MSQKSSQSLSDKARSSFARVLISNGPSPQMPKSAASVFGWLVGDWEAKVYDYRPGKSPQWVGNGEWHFSWVLEGRAIQDVWIVPKLMDRNSRTPKDHNRYGTTLRIYDPKIDAWRVFWFNPVTQDRTEIVARKIGNDIIQQGIDDDGSFVRWIFTDIKPNSFVWRGDSSKDGGKTWQLDSQFVVRRVNKQQVQVRLPDHDSPSRFATPTISPILGYRRARVAQSASR